MRTPVTLTAAIVIAIAGAAIPGCEEQPQATSQSNPATMNDEVLTTFYPTKYFAERVSGGLVPVRTALPEGEDPIFWQPDQGALAQYQNAKLVITNGAGFEKWAANAALPRARTVASLTEQDLTAARGSIIIESTTHSHGAAGEHTHEGVDGHTWVSPDIAIVQATNIAEAMKAAWPDHADAFDANLATLVEDLEMLRTSLQDLTPNIQQHHLIASHPAYNYLARDMGWDVHNLDLDPESSGTEAIVNEVRNAIEGADKGRLILLWESEPTDAIRTTLTDELSVTSVLFSPAEGTPDNGDYMDVVRANIDRLREAVGG